MHVPTHLLSGWCLANCVKLTARERACCMLAAAAPDLDGIGRIFGEETYWRYHHVVGHNLPFILLVAAVFALCSTHRWKAFAMYVLMGHAHLLMDYFGSGPGWTIAYWWPFSGAGYKTDLAWPLYSWQNMVAAGALLIWTLGIAVAAGRTPVELIAPDLDRRWVAALRKIAGYRQTQRIPNRPYSPPAPAKAALAEPDAAPGKE